MGETIGMGILDSGCVDTVCGESWFQIYNESLSLSQRKSIRTEPSNAKYRFGSGPVYICKEKKFIPVHIGSFSAVLGVNIVKCDVPLLISRKSLKIAECTLDFSKDSITLFGEKVPLYISRTGHYCISLSRSILDPFSYENRVLFSIPLDSSDPKYKSKIVKLHKQFAHPDSDRLKGLLKNTGVSDDQVLLDCVDDVTSACAVCVKYKRTPPRPVVSFPLATCFNEVVAMDLKVICGKLVLHLIDHATRYSAALVIPNKNKETIIKTLFEIWIRIFGAPTKFFHDNGGEFVNEQFLIMAEKFNISVKTTAAESAWSNGMCERHNGLLADHVNKVLADIQGCSLSLAIHWAVAAKNSLLNVYGFSPNQLVFGRNPALPNVYSNKLPANQNHENVSHHIAENLAAMHSARKAFIQQESCEKVRRALSKQTRNVMFFRAGESVYFKRANSNVWHGPATVMGRDSQMYLLKHGGIYIRVHPCRMQPVEKSYVQENPQPPANVHSGTTTSGDNHQEACDSSTSTSAEPEQVWGDVNNNANAVNESDTHDDVIAAPAQVLPNDQIIEPVSHEIINDQPPVLGPNVLPDVQMPPNASAEPTLVSHAAARQAVAAVELQPVAFSSPKTTVTTHQDLPQKGASISYKLPGGREWHSGDVISTGWQHGRNWDSVNMQSISDPNEKYSVSLKGAEWKLNHRDHNEEAPNPDNAYFVFHNRPPNPSIFNISCYDDLSAGDVPDTVFFSEQGPRFDIAKQEELTKWREMGAFQKVHDTGQTPRVSCRWVLTEKVKDGVLVTKARLVARGFEEDDPQIQTDSPTCLKESIRILLLILASNNWTLHSLDVKSAYLQGIPISRELYLEPPQEANCPGEIWLLKRCIYGLSDGGRLWYKRVVQEMKNLDAIQLRLDLAVFVWFDKEKNLSGIIVVHVDDFIYGGNKLFHLNVVSQLKNIFIVGSESTAAMKYVGIDIAEKPDAITISTAPYLESLKEIDTSVYGSDRSRELQVKTPLRKVSGQLMWITSQNRIELSYENCMVANSISKGTVQDIFNANKAIRKAKGASSPLFYPRGFDMKSATIVAYGDASYGNLPGHGSQGGYLVFLVDNTGKYCPLTWQSKRLQRVVGSTLAAECLAIIKTAEAAIHVKALLKEILPNISPAIHVFSDNKSLVSNAHSSTSIDDRHLQISMAILRDLLQQDIHELRWIPSKNNLADPLTKSSASYEYLLQVLRYQCIFDIASGTFINTE